jgi:hypothetical protein
MSPRLADQARRIAVVTSRLRELGTSWRLWLISGRLGSEGNPRGFDVGLRERIIDGLVFGAVGSDLWALWLLVAFVIPRFVHVYLQAQSAACQGRVRQKQDRVCHNHDSPRANATRRTLRFYVQDPESGPSMGRLSGRNNAQQRDTTLTNDKQYTRVSADLRAVIRKLV